MCQTVNIGPYGVGNGKPMFIIGEVGLAHDGSLGAAHAYIDAAAECGVDAVKFQTHIPEAESSRYEQFRVNVFPQDATRLDYWRRTSFEKEQWIELANHSREAGLIFLSSPFSHEAVNLLQDCQTPAWKVASGEVTNLPLLKHMAETRKPILVSSGMSSWEELDTAVQYLTSFDAEFALFQCTTAYPCPPEKWGLNVITEMQHRYDCPIGLSDHSGTIFPSLAAKVMGASLIEFHVVFSQDQFGPDSKASLTFEQTKLLVDGIRMLEAADANPIDKNQIAAESENNRQLFSKSLYATRDLAPGTVLSKNDICIKKPLLGLPAADFDRLIGRKTKNPIAEGDPIKAESLGQ